jgi:hypothetical protein
VSNTDADAANRLFALLEATTRLPANQIARAADLAGRSLGAASARLLLPDYALRSLVELGEAGPTGERQSVEGTLAGRAFCTGSIVTSPEHPTTTWVPLADGSDRRGVLELTGLADPDDERTEWKATIRALVLLLTSMRRYTDVIHRSRRVQPLDIAAEMQWDLLPPLSCTTDGVSISGMLEPAYSIGGDSFDYAFDLDRVDFAIIDAVGHGMSAVMIAAATLNSLRNARREGAGLEESYLRADQLLREQFGRSAFVTGQLGTLATATGELRWINAGHPLPLAVRDNTCIGELSCRPSRPMGLGGPVVEVATERLHRGDRLLFYSDGVIEARAPDREAFGAERLADLLVRATLDELPSAETVRRLSANASDFYEANLNDDATLLLVDFRRAENDWTP